jgi:hypothetical protein
VVYGREEASSDGTEEPEKFQIVLTTTRRVKSHYGGNQDGEHTLIILSNYNVSNHVRTVKVGTKKQKNRPKQNSKRSQ